jgi:hypothetical protein
MSVTPLTQARNYAWLAALIFTLLSVLFIHSRAYSANDDSRLASIDSLVTRGTWVIDDSIFNTIDKIKVGDHFYSDKPPMLSFAGAGIYSLLRNIFGLSLQATACDVDRSPTHCRAILEIGQADGAYFLLVFLLMTLPGALITALIYRLAHQRGFSQRASFMIALAASLGTSIWPYTTVFTNHAPSAAALIVAMYLLLTHAQPTRGQLGLIGFCAALSAAIDLSNAIFAVGLFIYIAWHYRSKTLWFIAGAVIPIAITIVLDYQIIGGPLPPQTYTVGYDYTNAKFSAAIAGNVPAQNVPRYMFDLLIGQRGLFMFFPIVIWFLMATINTARSSDHKTKWLVRISLIGSGLYFLYFALSTDNFGGNGFSPRWLLNPAALLALLAVTDRVMWQSRWHAIVFTGLAAYSVFQASLGVLNPWTPALPLLRFDYTAPQLPQPPNVVMSGYSTINALPFNARDLLGTNDITPRQIDVARTLVITKGSSWYFIDDSAEIAPEIAQLLGLNVPTTLMLNIDLNPAAQKWLDTFSHSASLDSGVPIRLPITFNNELVLLGYQIQSKPNKLTIITVWQVSAAPQYQEQRKAFFDFVSPDGEILQHNESLSVTYDTLQVGDTLFHVRTFSTSSLRADQYTLQIGIVDPDRESRLMSDGGSDHIVVTLK